jgi:hypothetical protein
MVIQILLNAGSLPGLNDFLYYPSNFFWLQSQNLLGVWKHRDKSLGHAGIVAESSLKRKWIEFEDALQTQVYFDNEDGKPIAKSRGIRAWISFVPVI